MSQSLKSRAVKGDDNAAELLRSAGIQSLQSRAAIKPKTTRAKNPKKLLKRIKVDDAILNDTTRLREYSEFNFNDFEEAEQFYIAHHLKPLMPIIPLARMNDSLLQIWQWLDGRGWIAGSAALWAADDKAEWEYGDIDIFCQSIKDYETLKAELKAKLYHGISRADSKGEYSTKFASHPFARWVTLKNSTNTCASLSLISPVDKDWSTVEGLLTGFDLSICAIAIANPKKAYSWSTNDVSRWRISRAIRIEFPDIAFERLFKYMKRGYRPSSSFLEDLVRDGRFNEKFDVLETAAEYTDSSHIRALVRDYREAQNWLEIVDAPDYEAEEEYEEEYPYS